MLPREGASPRLQTPPSPTFSPLTTHSFSLKMRQIPRTFMLRMRKGKTSARARSVVMMSNEPSTPHLELLWKISEELQVIWTHWEQVLSIVLRIDNVYSYITVDNLPTVDKLPVPCQQPYILNTFLLRSYGQKPPNNGQT